MGNSNIVYTAGGSTDHTVPGSLSFVGACPWRVCLHDHASPRARDASQQSGRKTAVRNHTSHVTESAPGGAAERSRQPGTLNPRTLGRGRKLNRRARERIFVRCTNTFVYGRDPTTHSHTTQPSKPRSSSAAASTINSVSPDAGARRTRVTTAERDAYSRKGPPPCRPSHCSEQPREVVRDIRSWMFA
jgi:hypothetical protein